MFVDRVMIDPLDLMLPDLPPSLEGLKVVHISDLHIRRRRARHRRILAGLDLIHADLAVLTGDYIDRPGDEQIGLAVMGEICDRLAPPLGIYGVFGNHDTPEARRQFAELPVRWLNDTCCRPTGLPLQIAGFVTGMIRRPDVVATLFGLEADTAATVSTGAGQQRPSGGKTVRLLLCHLPTYLPTAADLGVDLMIAGHTHGGQCRLPGRQAICNSSDLPASLTSGLLRHRNTLCVVSRGLGETIVPFRVFCPPHIPLYTLRRGSMPGQRTDHVVNIRPW